MNFLSACNHRHVHSEFVHMMQTYNTKTVGTAEIIPRIKKLFAGNHDLILAFNYLLTDSHPRITKADLDSYDHDVAVAAVDAAPESMVVASVPERTTSADCGLGAASGRASINIWLERLAMPSGPVGYWSKMSWARVSARVPPFRPVLVAELAQPPELVGAGEMIGATSPARKTPPTPTSTPGLDEPCGGLASNCVHVRR